jgi:hypothetical protein
MQRHRTNHFGRAGPVPQLEKLHRDKMHLPRNDHAITPPDTGRPPLQSSKHIVVCGTHFELSARALIRG